MEVVVLTLKDRGCFFFLNIFLHNRFRCPPHLTLSPIKTTYDDLPRILNDMFGHLSIHSLTAINIEYPHKASMWLANFQ